MCAFFFYSINNVSPGAIRLLRFWEVGVYRFHLGEEADVMQQKFLPVTGMGGRRRAQRADLRIDSSGTRPDQHSCSTRR